MSISSEVQTENDDESRKWIDRIYKKAVLPIQINASSATYKIFREYIKSKYDDYEDAKKEGDRLLKKCSKELPDYLMQFDIPDNISLDVDFYETIIHYKTPVSLASYEGDMDIVLILARMGVNYTKKTAMRDEGKGNDPIRMAEREDGFENAIGLPGPSAEAVRSELEKSRFWEKYPDLRMTLSVGGSTKEEYLDVFRELHDDVPYLEYVDFEINVSCPNTDDGQKLCEKQEGCDTYENLEKLLEEIREIDNDIPIYVKLSPDFSDEKILELAEICKRHKMGIVLTNTKYVDSDVLSTGGGGYSGPKNKERALQLVNLVHEKYKEYDKYSNLEFDKIPLKICGGMETCEDVLRAQNAGGNVPVQMGYAMFKDPYGAIVKTNYGLSKFCEKNGISSLNDFHDLAKEVRGKYAV
ncbi:MAG: hypothetical protein KAS90_01620 [Candidatus Aenigmarchaeota archaeon]|nr:hypothetical protein [Candidatus Aenigmarchaeota archaeon]